MKNSFKNLSRKILNRYERETKQKTYMRFFVMILFTALTYLITVMFFFGAILVEKVLIINPTPTSLSSDRYEMIRFFKRIADLFLFGTLLATMIVLWKEMKEKEFRKTLKAYEIPVIE